MTYVKVCGLRTVDAVHAAIEAGADAIGVVMSSRSPRHVDTSTARALIAAAAGRVDTVLVTNELDAEDAARTAEDIGASVLQLHGDYTHDDFIAARRILPRLWRATSLRPHTEVRVGAFGEEVLLLDAPTPGAGERWDLTRLGTAPTGHWVLAGGLTPENVDEAIRAARPWGVDVSSGVESERGVKSIARIQEFVRRARSAPRG